MLTKVPVPASIWSTAICWMWLAMPKLTLTAKAIAAAIMTGSIKFHFLGNNGSCIGVRSCQTRRHASVACTRRYPTVASLLAPPLIGSTILSRIFLPRERRWYSVGYTVAAPRGTIQPGKRGACDMTISVGDRIPDVELFRIGARWAGAGIFGNTFARQAHCAVWRPRRFHPHMLGQASAGVC